MEPARTRWPRWWPFRATPSDATPTLAPSSDAPPPDTPEHARIAALTGARPVRLALYAQAFRHRSALRGQSESHHHSNERLEFLGDAILEAVVSEHLYHTFPDTDEGFLSRLRAKLVSGRALAQYALRLHLGAHLEMSDEMRAQGGERHTTLLADAFEALIGAIYLDLGAAAAQAFVHRTVLDGRDLGALAEKTDNFKSALLEAAQGRGLPQPTYRTVRAEGAAHSRTFTIEAIVGGQAMGEGQAQSKKAAEQLAARAALEKLQQAPD